MARLPRSLARRLRAWLGFVTIVIALLPHALGAASAGSVAGTGGDGVWLKAAPALAADRIIVLPEGTSLQVLQGPTSGSDGLSWAQVQALDETGWIAAQYLQIDSPPPVAAAPPPADTLPAGSWATVTNTSPADGLRLRTDPMPWADLIAVLLEGSTLHVDDGPLTGSNGDPRYQVTAQGQAGWVDGIYLTPTNAPDPGEAVAPPAAPTTAPDGLGAGAWAQVTNVAAYGGLKLRVAPAPHEQLLTAYSEGTLLHILEGPATGNNGDPWYRVAWNGSWGWVDGVYLAAANPPSTNAADGTANGQALVNSALAQVGKKYVWGGNGPDVFDCSGLMVFSARQALGISLPRTAAEQAFAGIHVDRADLQPGDLVFFENTYMPGITHVGIYIGNNRWVTAEDEQNGVTILTLDVSYWQAHYAGARRIT
jgi:peptidoglycan DL-endopeptidase LytF